MDPSGRLPSASCPVCGGDLNGALGSGLCPACLVALALKESEPDGDVAFGHPSYRVLAVLAEEESRTTYLARDERGRLVTLDVVGPGAALETTEAAFRARLATLRALAHPGILPVLDGRPTADGGFCLVGQYVPGPTAESGAQPGWGVEGTVQVLDRICEALAYAHGLGVTHGRLGPSSVILVGWRDGADAVLTGWDVRDAAAGPRADLRGLGEILAVLTRGLPGPSPLDAVVELAWTCPSVAALRAALPRRNR